MLSINTELCSVHGPSDELLQLRRELARLGESCQEVPLHDAPVVQSTVELQLAAAAHTRVHSEPIALRLELDFEEAALMEALKIAEITHRQTCDKRLLEASELAFRGQICSEEDSLLQALTSSYATESERVSGRLKRAAVIASQRAVALESIAHERMIIEMDKSFLKQEALYAREVRQLREADRKEAEAQMRARMTAEKRVILPDEEMSTKQPFLLSSFERFVPHTSPKRRT